MIIFIHGLSGSYSATWSRMIGCFANDAIFDNYTIDCYQYPTRIFSLPLAAPPPGLRSLADGLQTFIEEKYGKSLDISIVAHSLGGLIARQHIVNELRAQRALRITRLALVAVPNNGAALASAGSLISRAILMLRRLSQDEDALHGLNADWEHVAPEDRLSVRYITGGADRVVSPDSSQQYLGRNNRSVLVEHNHRSIVQAENSDDIRFTTLRRFILESDLPLFKSAGVIPAIRSRMPDPLFDSYSLENEEFYIERPFDRILNDALSRGNVWVSGISGAGKTASLRRTVLINGWSLNHLSLAAYDVRSAIEVIRAICTELAAITGNDALPPEDGALTDYIVFLRNTLQYYDNHLTIAITVEEIPLGPLDLVTLASMITKITNGLGADPKLAGRLIFALSSIHSLVSDRSNPSVIDGKIRERLQLLTIDRWSLIDTRRLITMLTATVRPALSAADQDAIAISAHGSPRFVKMVYRHWKNMTDNEMSTSDLLTRVGMEMIQ